MKPDRGDSGLDNNFAEVADEKVDGIEEEEVLDRGVVIIDGVEDGGHIH